MKNLKKLLAWLVAGVICCSASVGLTAAYLTDRDSEANIFTVGDVRIDLTEDFKQGAWLVPGEKIEKETQIENTGKSDAYVWMTLAIPTALDVKGDASKNIVHWNIPGAFWEGYHQNQTYIDSAIEKGWLPDGSTGVAADDTWNVDDKVPSQEITIKGKEYRLFTFLYNRALKPGEKTNIGLSNVYLDTHIDIAPNGDWHWVENGETGDPLWNVEKNGYPIIYVSAYGIQSSGFATPLDGYNAYGVQWGEEGAEWGTLPIVVANRAELNNALGKEMILINDIESNATINNKSGTVIWLNGYSIICEDNSDNVHDVNNGSTVIGNSGVLTIHGGSSLIAEAVPPPGHGKITCYGITNHAGGEVYFYDVDVSTVASSSNAVTNSGKFVIDGGKFTVDPDQRLVCVFQNGGVGEMVIDNAVVDVALSNEGIVFVCSGGIVTINGGTYKTTDGALFKCTNGGKVVVNGGTFSEDPTTYTGVTVNGTVTNNGNGTWTVA